MMERVDLLVACDNFCTIAVITDRWEARVRGVQQDTPTPKVKLRPEIASGSYSRFPEKYKIKIP
jgi:hypothetical protein